MTRSTLIAIIVTVLLVGLVAANAKPIPSCITPYGINDPDVCIAADGYPYKHGIQVG